MVLSQDLNNIDPRDGYCLSALSLNLSRNVAKEWNNHTLSLNRVGVLLSNINDDIIWDKNNINGVVRAKQAYSMIVEDEAIGSHKWWMNYLWKKTYPFIN